MNCHYLSFDKRFKKKYAKNGHFRYGSREDKEPDACLSLPPTHSFVCLWLGNKSHTHGEERELAELLKFVFSIPFSLSPRNGAYYIQPKVMKKET